MLATALMVMGCGSAKSGKESSDSTNSSAQTSSDNSDSKKAEAPQIDGLTYESAMDLTYAQEFDVFYYKDGYKLIDVHEGRQYLIVPEGKEAPKGLDSDIVVIHQPVQNIYMAATAIMSLFDALDAIQKETGKLPLVLHGGTGIPEDMIKKAITLGVSKINVNTECQLYFQEATRKYIEAGKDLEGKGFDPRKLLAPGAAAIQECVKEKMEIFGCIGKA